MSLIRANHWGRTTVCLAFMPCFCGFLGASGRQQSTGQNGYLLVYSIETGFMYLLVQKRGMAPPYPGTVYLRVPYAGDIQRGRATAFMPCQEWLSRLNGLALVWSLRVRVMWWLPPPLRTLLYLLSSHSKVFALRLDAWEPTGVIHQRYTFHYNQLSLSWIPTHLHVACARVQSASSGSCP